MTRVSKWNRGRIFRPRLRPLSFWKPGAKTLNVFVEPGNVESVIEDYRLLGWELI